MARGKFPTIIIEKAPRLFSQMPILGGCDVSAWFTLARFDVGLKFPPGGLKQFGIWSAMAQEFVNALVHRA